jgi:hypothetical protein
MLLVHGVPAVVAKAINVPHTTLSKWQADPAWEERMLRVRQANIARLDAGLTRCLDKALAQVEDRIDYGDERLVSVRDEGGAVSVQPTRVKMSGRDLAVTAGILFDKRQLLRGVSPAGSRGPIEDRLETLARALQSRQVEGQSVVRALGNDGDMVVENLVTNQSTK